MGARYLLALALALAAAATVAACGGDASSLSGGTDTGQNPKTNNPAASGGAPSGGTTPAATPGTLPTNSTAGKDYFAQKLQPIFDAKCSTCHVAGGAGNPTWMVKGDASKTYDMVFLNGFAVVNSRIVIKGSHDGGLAPELTPDEKTLFGDWITLESNDGGTKTQANVLAKFGDCFDQTKFDAINFKSLVTTRRQNGNNPKNLTENANNCTGCDNTPCRACHSADDVTGFIMAVGNPIFPADYTFQETKKLDPAFIRQYVSTTPTGEPQFNPGVMSKSTNTIEQGLAYSHPMFILTPAMSAAIQAFVDDALTKYKAGSCGK